ncbi:MAG: LamG domain-containing protein, partial [Planctomycetes bacterium]|nr:LamG domain-containing protein [Planctomycetota bacterium]
MWQRCICSVLLMGTLAGVASGAFDPLQESSLIGWWKCDEGQGNVVGDSSPNKRDGTFVNGAAAWTTGVFGSAIRLVGPTLVEIPAPSLRLTQATMAGWFLPNGPQPDWASMIMHRGTGLAHGFNFLADRRLAYHWADAANTWSYRGNAYYAADEWTHCAVTVEPDKATFYVNGVSASVNTVTHPEANWNNPIFLGGDGGSNWVGRRMNGALDDVMFFSQALPAAKIRAMVPPKVKAMKPIPADKAIGVTMPLLQWTKGETAIFHNVYLGTSPDLTEANLVAARQPFAMYYHLGVLLPGTTYYWRVDEIEADMVTIHKGDVWSFATEPLAAYQPKPADGAGNLMPALTLSWLPGKAAVKHRVYFSSTLADVESGAGAANKGDLTETTFKPGVLRASTTYYWRVDEVKADGSVEKGPIWSFTTQDGVAKKIVRQWWNGIGGTALSALTGSPNFP